MDIAFPVSIAPAAPVDLGAAVPVAALPGEGFAGFFDAALGDPAIPIEGGAPPVCPGPLVPGSESFVRPPAPAPAPGPAAEEPAAPARVVAPLAGPPVPDALPRLPSDAPPVAPARPPAPTPQPVEARASAVPAESTPEAVAPEPSETDVAEGEAPRRPAEEAKLPREIADLPLVEAVPAGFAPVVANPSLPIASPAAKTSEGDAATVVAKEPAKADAAPAGAAMMAATDIPAPEGKRTPPRDSSVVGLPIAEGESEAPFALRESEPIFFEAAPTGVAKALVAPAPVLEAAHDLGIVPKAVVDVPASAVSLAANPLPIKPSAGSPEPVAVEAAETKAETKGAAPSEVLVDAAPAEKAPAENGGAPSDDAPKDNASQEAPAVRTVATERPEAGAERPSVDRHLVVRQVADRIENLVASRPRDGVTIHLEPRDLGTVTLVVKGLASALDVQMFASDDRVRESLETARPELAQALAPRQIEIRELRVSAAPTPTSTNSNSGQQSGANPEGRPRPHAPQPSFPGRPAKAEAAVRAARAGRGVDLLV